MEWSGCEDYGINTRLENRVFGKVKGAALSEALRIVRHNGSLDISGEYGSIDTEDQEFHPDSKLQDEMNRRYESVTSEGDLRAKEMVKRHFQS